MRIEELKASLANGASPAYLIEGEDAYLREVAVKILKDRFLTSPELNLNLFEGSYVKSSPDEMVDALMQYPFMSEKRVVIVRDYSPSATDLKNKSLVNYFANPVETSLLIIVNNSACEPLKKIDCITVVDCGKANVATVVRYIQGTLKRNNLIITTKNAELLAEYCKLEMTKISGEVEKLIAYCHGEAEVSADAIEELVIKENDYQVYELTEQVARKNSAKAYAILADMLSKSNDHQRIFTALYYHFRKLFFCSVSNKSTAVLAKEIGVKSEYALKKLIEQSKRFTPKKLKQTIDMFVKYDADFKSGKITIAAALNLAMGKIME
jgi:DNA polymerase-3 subunit delta